MTIVERRDLGVLLGIPYLGDVVTFPFALTGNQPLGIDCSSSTVRQEQLFTAFKLAPRVVALDSRNIRALRAWLFDHAFPVSAEGKSNGG